MAAEIKERREEKRKDGRRRGKEIRGEMERTKRMNKGNWRRKKRLLRDRMECRG